jgi:hypothetical protein
MAISGPDKSFVSLDDINVGLLRSSESSQSDENRLLTLNVKRKLSRQTIAIFANDFHVEPTLFVDA